MLKRMSIRWKVAIPIIFSFAAAILILCFFTGFKTESIVVNEVRDSTLSGYRDTILNTLTTMMLAGNIKETKGPFLEQMKHIANVSVLRSESVDKDFGPADSKDYASDSVEKDVIRTGKAIVNIEGTSIRGVYPYTARSDFMGKNCLSCHNVSEGTVLGAISIKVPLMQAFDRIHSMQYLYLELGLLGIALLTGVVLGIIHVTHSPLTTLIGKVKRVGEGYTDTSLYIEGTDEIARMSQHVDSVISHFSKMVNGIITSSHKIMPAVDILKSQAEVTSKGAQNQSRLAQQIATAAEQMSLTITDIAKNASIASDTSSHAMDKVQNGRQITDTTVATIHEVNKSAGELDAMFKKLNGQVAEIGNIVTVITDIADQTNLLALNAAIEAARAGDEGRGFAVVADEVRKLAERTIKATSEIAERIKSVQTESALTSKSMEKSIIGVTKATGHVKSLNDVLQTIVESVQTARDQITRIAAAVEEQSAASSEVACNIEQTASISQDMEKMAIEVTHEIGKLVGVAQELATATAEIKT